MIHELFAADELEPGTVRTVDVDGISILIVRRPDGAFRAIRDVCPHLGVPLSRGTTQYVVGSDDVGAYRWTDTYAARCSWHGYEFDVDTGRCVADPRSRVKTYPVTIEDGKLLLER